MVVDANHPGWLGTQLSIEYGRSGNRVMVDQQTSTA